MGARGNGAQTRGFLGLFLTGQKVAESELAGLARFAGEREYTPEVFQRCDEKRDGMQVQALGDLLGSQLTEQQMELLHLLSRLSPLQQESLLQIARDLVS